MSLKHVYEKLLKIKDTSSTNAKILLLSEYLQNDEFKRVIQLMYSDDKHFMVNKIAFSPINIHSGIFTNKDIFDFLETLAAQKGTSNYDKDKLAMMASIDKETVEVVKMIINKDAKAGFSGKTINSAYPNLILLYPYCRCSTESKIDNIKYPAFVQEKADGAFVNMIINQNTIEIRTRNGKLVHQLDSLKNQILKGVDQEFSQAVFHGELLVRKNGKFLDRKTGNGIINSCISNTADQADAECVHILLWDMIPYDDFMNHSCDIGYRKRIVKASKFSVLVNTDRLGIIKTKRIDSLQEAREFYTKMRAMGKEGAIVKNANAKWAFKTSTDMIKLKNISEAELRIVGWKYGKKGTKYEKCMGALLCESEDGLVKVSISGFTDEQRLEDWDSKVGKIISVLYESIIKDKSKEGLYSLYLPRFDSYRFDRSYADTLEDIKGR